MTDKLGSSTNLFLKYWQVDALIGSNSVFCNIFKVKTVILWIHITSKMTRDWIFVVTNCAKSFPSMFDSLSVLGKNLSSFKYCDLMREK